MNIFKTLTFLIILGGFFLLNLLLPAPDFLQSERRPPASVPQLTLRSVTSGDFTDRFESAAADGFPFREQFRTLRAAAVLGAFMQSDKNGLYLDEHGIGEIKPTDKESAARVTEKINAIIPQMGNANVYYSFIPDKSWYAGEALPGFDAEAVKDVFTPKGKFIDISSALNAESFYRTDLHWNQAELGGVVSALAAGMSFEEAYTEADIKTAGNFAGVYAGQLALPVGVTGGLDELKYFDVTGLGLTARYLNAQLTALEPGKLYDDAKLNGVDPYDFFLQGAQPLVAIDNNNFTDSSNAGKVNVETSGGANSEAAKRELFIFRDSFSSSLAPLLAASYSRVTLIDLRYIDMATLEKFVKFPSGSSQNSCDVLFLYSSQILNRAEVLR